MKLLLCVLLLGCPCFQTWGQDDAWSKPDKGLRGRLLILPAEKPDSPFCRVFIELQNTENALGDKKIRFTPEKLDLRVINKNGKELPRATYAYDGVSPLWEEPILLPYAGTIKFQISFPGLGYDPGKDKVIIDMGSDRSWIVPQTGDYFLAGRFTVIEGENDHPHIDWSGSIIFPLAKIPNAK